MKNRESLREVTIKIELERIDIQEEIMVKMLKLKMMDFILFYFYFCFSSYLGLGFSMMSLPHHHKLVT